MILFIDDEKRTADTYIEDLEEEGFEVVFKMRVDDGVLFIEEHLSKIFLVILDIMMPPEIAFGHMDTEDGLRTGVVFYRKIRELAPELPVVILTNVSDDQVGKMFKSQRNCRFLQKKDYLPFQLVDEVREILLKPNGDPDGE